MAELCVTGPAGHSFGDWVAASSSHPGNPDVISSGRLVSELNSLVAAVRVLQAAARDSSQAGFTNIQPALDRVGLDPAGAAALPVDARSSSSYVGLWQSWVAGTLSNALQSGKAAQCSSLPALLIRYHWATHTLVASKVLSQVLEQHAPVLLRNAHGILKQQ
jgi:hypothetical protein